MFPGGGRSYQPNLDSGGSNPFSHLLQHSMSTPNVYLVSPPPSHPRNGAWRRGRGVAFEEREYEEEEELLVSEQLEEEWPWMKMQEELRLEEFLFGGKKKRRKKTR